MLFKLENVSQVAFEDMNQVHREELIMVNDIYHYLTTSAVHDHQIIEKMLQEFAFHLRDHFLFEEDMMRETNCPIYSCHESEHIRVQKIMFQIFKEYAVSKNINLLKFYFEFEFKSWIENHILTMDTVTGAFLKDKGIISDS
ncbi:MAG: hemerythrin family protein [Bacteriovorax sp.]|nr:hemerythrin family protein [Bacteriovorax sp.]